MPKFEPATETLFCSDTTQNWCLFESPNNVTECVIHKCKYCLQNLRSSKYYASFIVVVYSRCKNYLEKIF